MKARVILKIKLGPFVAFEIDGESCRDIAAALEGFELLNERVDAMCSDLVERVYPNGMPTEPEAGEVGPPVDNPAEFAR